MGLIFSVVTIHAEVQLQTSSMHEVFDINHIYRIFESLIENQRMNETGCSVQTAKLQLVYKYAKTYGDPRKN